MSMLMNRFLVVCIFLGYADGIKGYILWCSVPKSPKFIFNRDVVLMNLSCFT
jgi:hypothetical protein